MHVPTCSENMPIHISKVDTNPAFQRAIIQARARNTICASFAAICCDPQDENERVPMMCHPQLSPIARSNAPFHLGSELTKTNRIYIYIYIMYALYSPNTPQPQCPTPPPNPTWAWGLLGQKVGHVGLGVWGMRRIWCIKYVCTHCMCLFQNFVRNKSKFHISRLLFSGFT